MKIPASDISIADSGDIRWSGDLPRMYTILELHQFLDKEKKGSSKLLTDYIIELIEPYNIDESLANHLYGGAIKQRKGKELYRS